MGDTGEKTNLADIGGLEALPDGSVIISAATTVIPRRPYVKAGRSWLQPGSELEFAASEIQLPATVLNLPRA
ncbi:hypothetical protein ASG92_18275 [Arthrobacter sp. Soil736]|uniref:hypothetical protein n=1 Tax=Arthrobacter sp. Soil736 TaxID=1736395 RepID=UPI0006FA4464|nr:hypothetical protein [Arthrobacter sp. Soil736]KRE64943.1 hypothetical protein ASG92_18275 [Arthrobacter sp. Soil736]